MKHLSILILFLGLASSSLLAQTVTGRVLTSDGAALVGATVVVKNTNLGANVDENGAFTLRVNSLNDTLICSYYGFEREEIPLDGRSQLDIVMQEAVQSLDEVVMVGYGSQRKSDLTGSISSVKSEDLNRIPTASVAQALQGRVAGVQVTPISGEPGAGAVIRIRGVGTLNDASPLFVVDGMLLDNIDYLNPQDIASMEILKDASATAIYGSRGANGVVIITTTQGQKGQTRFQFQAYQGRQEVTQQIDLVNAREFAELANEVAANENRSPTFEDPTVFGEGTNWQDEIFRQAPMRNYQLSASGGSEKMQYNLSANYFQQSGIIKGSEFDRLTLRLNNQYQLTSFLEVGHNLAFIRQSREVAAGVVANAYRVDPTVPPQDSLGNFSNTSINASVGNPAAQIFYQNNANAGFRTVGNAYLNLNFLDHFHFRTSLGLDMSNNRGKNFVPVFFVSPIQQNDESRLFVYTDQTQNWLWENTLTYQQSWDNHSLTVLGGVTAQEFYSENLGGQRLNLQGATDELLFLNAGEIDGQTNYQSAFEWSMLSYLFRVNYSLMNRYLFTASFRADGSSRFGPENRYGYFPSFALGWRVSDEPFLQNQDFINVLKLRASWGQIGNDKIGAYAGRAVVTSNLNAVFGPDEALFNGASLITLANPAIRWEETSQTNAGLEIAILDNRLIAEADFYRRVTNDILVDVPIPAYVGAANNPVVNAAQVLNQGWDFNLSWREVRGDWSYRIGGVASTVHNEVLALGEGKEEIFGGVLGVGGKLGTRTVVGLPIGAFYGYQVDGVFQNEAELEQFPTRGVEVPGDLRFVDTDGDGVITTDDRTYLGSPIPSLIYGAYLSVEYKGIDLTVDVNGQRGNYIINAKKMARFGTYNFEDSFLDRWTGEGTSDWEPRVTNGGHNYEMSERFLEDGSFFRLRNVQLGYSLPERFCQSILIDELRIYASGTNIFTATAYSGYTPEITSNSVIAVGIDQGVYPIAKVYVLGLNLGF
jgi:TonB-linked SusC/RagA family outer membrane protein